MWPNQLIQMHNYILDIISNWNDMYVVASAFSKLKDPLEINTFFFQNLLSNFFSFHQQGMV